MTVCLLNEAARSCNNEAFDKYYVKGKIYVYGLRLAIRFHNNYAFDMLLSEQTIKKCAHNLLLFCIYGDNVYALSKLIPYYDQRCVEHAFFESINYDNRLALNELIKNLSLDFIEKHLKF